MRRLLALFLAVLAPGGARAVDSTTVFSEVMYHPARAADSEWIELRNIMAVNMDLSGWRITGGVNFTFPANTTIAAGGHLVVAANPGALQSSAGISSVLGPWTGMLDNGSETIRLENRIGRVMDEFSYTDAGRFPTGADGGGVTLAKRAPELASDEPESWTYSGQVGGSPASENFPGGQTLGPPSTVAAFSDAWNFNQAGTNLGASWAATTYTAGANGWESGPGVFAFENDPLPAPVGTVLADPGPTGNARYFQRTFSLAGDPARTALRLTALVDDGATVYLNGFEVARLNMPGGVVDGGTRASRFVANAAFSAPIALPSERLLAGTNVLSVSVHGEPTGGGGNGGLALADQAGTMVAASNLALAANGGAAFAKDLLGNGSFAPTHTIPNLNNGTYGNPSSWIGNSANSYCAIRLGAAPRTVRSVAFGRDNLGTFSDRTLGAYTLQYTTAASPDATTPDSAWITIGTLNYAGAGGALFSAPARRHRYNFTAVQATGLRLITPGDGIGSGACIDEFEVYEAAAAVGANASPVTLAPAAGFTLAFDGVSGAHLGGPVPDNFANAAGAAPFGSSELGAGGLHTIAHINDGFYGNPNSWISAGGAGQFIGVRFAETVQFSRVAWGRDNTGTFSDRSVGAYTVQFTTLANPGVATAETDNAATGWKTIGVVTIGGDPTFAQGQRHEFTIAPTGGGLVSATGVRVKVGDSGACLDELEVAGPPQNDVVFGAQLLAHPILPAPGSSPLVINEIGGANDATWRIELRNNGSAGIDLGGLILASSNAAAAYTLPAQMLAPGALLVLDQAQLGFRPQVDDRVFLYNAGRTSLLDSAAVKTTARARLGAQFLTPVAATFGAENTFALQTDVVINELMIHFPPNPSAGGVPISDNPEEWIELHNRGSAAVSLAGWSLDSAVDFTFPAGASIPAGGYLVVAKDTAALAAKWPEQAARIIGDFTSSLANKGERVVLKDASGNPADELRYFTGGAWPGLPDGGGSSLELRDPRADNSVGAAWAASDESTDAPWQQVSYAFAAGQTFGQTLWNEFRIGMLGEGACLIDDVSVIRDPAGARQQLVQGGSFETLATKWRLLGNHGASTIGPEPGNAANTVLHVRASGAFGFNHNHIESTFLSNTALVTGQTYEVSFRARWLSGTNQLNTRGYYSRLARTTELTIPARLGTPGALNSRFTPNLGPTLNGLAHSPVIPNAGEPVTVSVRAADPDEIGSLTLRYATNGGTSFASVPMAAQGGGLHTASIPALGAGTIVQFYIDAQDALGATAQMPAAGPASRALYIVNDGQGSGLAAHELRILMLPADSAFMLAPLNRLSDARIGGTAIYRRGEVFYDAGVRLQGTAAGRIRDGESYTGYDVAFPADHLFRGVHDSVNIDRSGRAPAVRGQDEIYVKHMFHRAGVPCSYDDLIYLVAPASVHTGTAILQMAGYEATFVDSQFGDDGSVFNLDGTYEPSTATNGVESLKNPVPLATQLQTDFANLGADKEQYRAPLEIRAGRRRDDFAGLIAFCQTMALPNAQLAQQIGVRMDVDEWMRCAALYALCGIGDTYMTGGFQHNLRVYVPPSGAGVVALPWDMDFVFTAATNAPAILAAGNLRRVIDIPANQRLYYGHLQDLCATVFNSSTMSPWLAHYGSVVGQPMTGQLGYIEARRMSVQSQLPASPAFAITTNGGADFSINTSQATLEGTGGINIREFRRADTGAVLTPEWPTLNGWRLVVALHFGENPITLQAYDFQGQLIATDSIVITSTLPAADPRESLRVTELHYHPAAPSGAELNVSTDKDDFEFIELRNLGSQPLDISGCAFVAGVDFVFPSGATLAAGEFIHVVRHVAAFQARYGSGPRVAGAYGPQDSLSNSGETIALVDATGASIQSFTYDDSGSWPVSADGAGRSLVPVAPHLALDRDEGENWRPSLAIGGSPSGADAGSVFSGSPTADADGDGVSALMEHALGTSDASTASGQGAWSVSRDAAGLLFTFRRRLTADDLAYAVEFSTSLGPWSTAFSERTAQTHVGADVIETWRIVPPAGSAVGFARLRVTQR